ncbi:hypothetical protein B9Q03_09750 [Candidatus Marsarchaeota G2 archaeon OSP_D]|uniref:Uncharacterized protein n=1 Tax=Candidatus Marsarchaeota G2 archaeon OSP_D TaxID=1978157 RepID=A0A2R6ANQ9_9ARCH|nr:MAG: hypothetical protein B9Q03_09750 [Candidatus Marsarchaeota G2 archaeon OSP_D]
MAPTTRVEVEVVDVVVDGEVDVDVLNDPVGGWVLGRRCAVKLEPSSYPEIRPTIRAVTTKATTKDLFKNHNPPSQPTGKLPDHNTTHVLLTLRNKQHSIGHTGYYSEW